MTIGPVFRFFQVPAASYTLKRKCIGIVITICFLIIWFIV